MLNAFVYIAAGAGPHPVVILLHGFPGNEKNLDLAQTLRRNGYDVLYFNYRGSWGTPGTFSFSHAIEDAQAALDYFRAPDNAKLFRADANSIFLVGHSMGGMIAAYTAAHDPHAMGEPIRGTVMISGADMAGYALHPHDASPEIQAEVDKKIVAGVSAALAAEGMAPLAGCTPDSLAAELVAHPEWTFQAQARRLTGAPLLVLTSDDGGAQPSDDLVSAIQAAGGKKVVTTHMATDHSYSGVRLELTQTVLDFITAH